MNANVLARLTREGVILFEQHGNLKIIDFDELWKVLRYRLDLDGQARVIHIRSIDDAVAEIRETLPDLGIGDDRIRKLVKVGTIPSIRVGNRSYIPMEAFHAPYDYRLKQSHSEVAERRGLHYRYKSYAEEQLDSILEGNARSVKIKRAK